MSNRYYFAYGSNLNEKDLRGWCTDTNHSYPLLTSLGKAWLPDYQLLFNYYSSVRKGGALNIRPRTGYAVPGILFQLTAGGREILLLKERAPEFYQELKIIVLDANGVERRGITFTAAPHRHSKEHIPPSPFYRHTVEEGMRQHDLNPSIFHSACHGKEKKSCLPLFVYGTLMQGEFYHSVLQPWFSEAPRQGTARGHLYDLGKYPGMVHCSQHENSRVHGEIYPSSPHISKILKELDRIEGFAGHGKPGSLYSRVVQKITAGTETLPAWLYLLNKRVTAPLIHSGNWRRR